MLRRKFHIIGFRVDQFLGQNGHACEDVIMRTVNVYAFFCTVRVKEGAVYPNPSRLSHDNPNVYWEGLKLRKVPHHREADMLVLLDILLLAVTMAVSEEQH
jgi:hypothetical protein